MTRLFSFHFVLLISACTSLEKLTVTTRCPSSNLRCSEIFNSTIVAELRSARDDYLRSQQETFNYYRDTSRLPVQIGESVQVGASSYLIKKWLGYGTEGFIFKGVDKDGNSVSLKFFRSQEKANNNYERLLELNRILGSESVVKVIDFDSGKKLMVMEYIFGTNLGSLKSSKISEDTRMVIDKKLDELRKRVEDSPYSLHRENIIVSIPDLNLIVIDPT